MEDNGWHIAVEAINEDSLVDVARRDTIPVINPPIWQKVSSGTCVCSPRSAS